MPPVKRKPPLSQVQHGDTVTADVRGRIFEARVTATDPDAGTLTVEPPAGITYRSLTYRQVKGVRRWTPDAAIR